MLSISVTLLTIIFTALSSAEHNEQLAVADLSFLSNTPPSVLVSDELTTLLSKSVLLREAVGRVWVWVVNRMVVAKKTL